MITSILQRMQPNRPHLAILVVLLLCSVLLTGFLTYQGYDAARNQRLQAEQSLRDWAQLAASEWHSRVQQYLYQGLYWGFSPALYGFDPAMPAPTLEHVVANVPLSSICRCFDADDVRTYFQLDMHRGELRTTGSVFTPVVRGWIADAIESRPAASASERWSIGVLIGAPDGNQRVVVYAVMKDERRRPGIAYGLVLDAGALAKYLDTVWRTEDLLPRTAMRGMPNDWLLSAKVTDGHGNIWYQSGGRYPALYTARDTMDRILNGVAVTVAVSPDAAPQLLIGGMPSSRLPTLFVLMALTAGLLLISIGLIRREAEITRLRADFIAGVSHELRTPLAQIRMFAETLMLGRVRSEAEWKKSLEIIDQEARRLTHLVENVLLFARAERRSGRINPEPINLATDIRDAVHGFAILSRSKAVDIRAEVQDGVTAAVDRGALRQILLNLLDNAVKYGPLAQRVTVGMAMFDSAVRIWVDDEGKGIPESERGHVFESFFRLERDITSPVAGSGIGLSIVRELVTLHDGRVWIEGAPGGGARVVVEFPDAYLREEAARDDWAVA